MAVRPEGRRLTRGWMGGNRGAGDSGRAGRERKEIGKDCRLAGSQHLEIAAALRCELADALSRYPPDNGPKGKNPDRDRRGSYPLGGIAWDCLGLPSISLLSESSSAVTGGLAMTGPKGVSALPCEARRVPGGTPREPGHCSTPDHPGAKCHRFHWS